MGLPRGPVRLPVQRARPPLLPPLLLPLQAAVQVAHCVAEVPTGLENATTCLSHIEKQAKYYIISNDFPLPLTYVWVIEVIFTL